MATVANYTDFKIVENTLIPIYQDDGDLLVDGRQLHAWLGADTKFADWIKRMIDKCRLAENEHFAAVSQNRESGGRSIEYGLTLDAVKHICMIQNNEKGFEARDYFIKADKRLRSPSARLTRKDLALLIVESEEERERLQAQVEQQHILIECKTKEVQAQEQIIEESKPIINEHKAFISSKGLLSFEEAAKIMDIAVGKNKIMGSQTLFRLCRELKLLQSTESAWNRPYQHYIDVGCFKVIIKPVWKGHVKGFENKPVTLITARGQSWLYKKINKHLGV